jgi:hypothetical protein
MEKVPGKRRPKKHKSIGERLVASPVRAMPKADRRLREWVPSVSEVNALIIKRK